MYSRFLFDGEDSRNASKMHFCKGIAVGFGAGLLLATVVTVAVLPSTAPGTGAGEPSSFLALPVSTASQSSISLLRGGNPVIAHGWRLAQDGRGHPMIGNTAVQDAPSFSQPYQPPVSVQAPAGDYSPEQLEFLRRAGKLPSMEQPVQQSASAQVSQGQYSPEQLEFMRRAGKLPKSEPQSSSWDSPQSSSWDSPASEVAQGRRDGYAPYQKQRFN